MPKRSARSPSAESSLSSAADDLLEASKSEVKGKPANGGKKRKAVTTTTKTTAVKRTKRTTAATIIDEEDVEETTDDKTRAIMKRVARTKKTVIQDPLAPRTQDSLVRIGAHVSTAGGIHNAIVNLLHIGANAFALFMKNQRKWDNPPLDPEFARLFIAGCAEHGIDVAACCLPHGSYLVNLAHPDAERKKQAYDSFLNDLARCHTLGIKLYNFHPGNANATTREEGIRLIAQNINEAHQNPSTGDVVAVLETMASHGNTIGGTFSDLAEIIKLVDNKDRVGVCLDTCHVFAAGYDLRTPKAYAATMKEFDDVIGLKYLKALHMNDSKAPLSSHRDLHANIGTGYLGLSSFHNIVNDKRLHGLPMVLETPIDSIDDNGKKIEDKGIWAHEIKMLESLVGMDIESDEFKELAANLEAQGKGERDKINDQVERKKVKDAKSTKTKKAAAATTKTKDAKPKNSRAKKKKKVETEDEENEEDEEE
ncbi:DNA-(apurinic or apyrimidinic site) lyase [Pleosporales sp. CAS-2024a]